MPPLGETIAVIDKSGKVVSTVGTGPFLIISNRYSSI